MNLTVRKLMKSYDTQKVLDDFCITAENVNCLAFIGPSGGGKSTALRHLCGLEKADSGTIRINNKSLPQTEKLLFEYRKSIGVVFQSYNLFPHLTALQNIILPLTQVFKFEKDESEHKAIKLLERFDLKKHAFKRPSSLSGGQNQRVAIARALAPNPNILFFDEPTSALDPEMTAEVLETIESLIREGKKIILVTHEMGFARRAAQQVAFITNGKVIEHGPSSKILENPQTEIMKKFLSKVLKY